MKLSKARILAVLCLSIAFTACRKDKEKISPIFESDVCPLVAVTNQQGIDVQSYDYVAGNLIRISSKDSIPTRLEFRYNEKNEVERMEVKTQGDEEEFVVNYFYDEEGNITRTTTSVSGIEFMENVFTTQEGKIAIVNTYVSLFGRTIEGITRIEYSNENVSKVYTSIDNDPEVLAFTGVKYDDKPQFNPPQYKIAALGFVGIANNFFSFFGRNNLVEGRIYDEKGKLDQKTNIEFIYDQQGLPMTAESFVERNGELSQSQINYTFDCSLK